MGSPTFQTKYSPPLTCATTPSSIQVVQCRRKDQSEGSLNNTPPVALDTFEQKGDLLFRNLWQKGMDSIHGMLVVNADVLSNRNRSQDKRLQTT